MLNNLGEIVIHKDFIEGYQWQQEKDFKGISFVKNIIQRKNGEMTYSVLNNKLNIVNEYVVVFRNIDNLNWIVVTGTLKEVYKEPLNSAKIFIFTFYIIFIASYLIQAFLFSRKIVFPITLLEKEMKSAKIDKKVKIMDKYSDDEIGELTRQFVYLNKSVNDYKEHLEKLVEKRTEELLLSYQKLEKREKFLKVLLDIMPNPIYYTDKFLRFTGCNKAFLDFFYVKKEDVIWKDVGSLFSDIMVEKERESEEALKKTNEIQKYEIEITTKKNTKKNLLINKNIYIEKNGEFTTVSIIEDITAIKSIEFELKKQVNIDSLTNLYNRRGIEEIGIKIFENAKQKKDKLSVFMIDLDNFKLYNDTYGHLMGDLCIINTAKSIKKACNREYDFVGRYGGEEYIVILPNTDLEGAKKVAEKIMENVNGMKIAHIKNGANQIVSVSIGLYTGVPALSDKIEDFISKADEKLYLAKKMGRNRCEC